MGFAAGKLERMIQGRKGKFNGYDIAGDWLVDVNGKQGWLVQLVGFGSFSVVDGEIYQSDIFTPGATQNSTDVVTAAEEAVLEEPIKQAISEAIAHWENEQSEKV